MMSCESPKTYRSLIFHCSAMSSPTIKASYSTILLVQGKLIQNDLGIESPWRVMNIISAPAPWFVCEPSKNNFHYVCIDSVNTNSYGKSITIAWLSCKGSSASWSSMICPFIAFLLMYSISNSLSIMTHFASLLVSSALFIRYLSGSNCATSYILWLNI